MKKRFTGILAALALLVGLTIPMGMWGQTRAEESLVALTFPDDNSSNNGLTSNQYQSTWTAMIDTYSWSISNFNNNNWDGWTYIKCGRKNNASVATITNSAAIVKSISRVAITIDALTVSKVNSIKLYTSSNGSIWTEAGSFLKAVGTQSVALSNPEASLYYKIEFDCASGSSNGLVTVSKVEYFYNEGNPVVVTPTITPDGGPFYETLEVSISCATAGATIHYTTNGDAPTTSSTVYSAPFTINANTIVKALAVKTNMDNSEIAIAEFTKVTPMSVADAIAAIEAASSTPIENQCVTGIVCTASSNIYSGKLSYWISDDGTETTRLEAYNGLGLYGDSFTSVDDVQVGDVVVIYGDLTKYNSTYEFAAGNYLLSLVRPVVPVIDATAGEALAYNATEGSIVYEITNYVEGTMTATTNAEWITNIAVEEVDDMGEVTFNVTTNNTGEVRTGVVTLTFTYDTDKTVTADVTVSQAALVLPVINAEDVNIAFTATSGSITYTIDNPIDGITLTPSVPSGSWLTLGEITATEVPFTCEANNGEARTETVTLTYGDITKDVTVTQAAYADIYTGEGTFNKVTALTDLEDGGYYVLYGVNGNYKGAMNSTCNSGKMGLTTVSVTNDAISDPATTIVWKLEANGDNWNLYNEASEKYCVINQNKTEGFALVDEPGDDYYTVSVADGDFSFVGQYGNRMISIYQSDFRAYASSNAKTLYLYKLGEASQDPYFTADNVVIEHDAETGSITYTVNNPVDGGTVTAEVTDGEWLTLGQGTTSPISFTCSANTDYTSREATVTLTYTYNNSKPAVTATVTVTQEGAPYPTTTYILATSIESGRHYIIANGEDMAMGAQGPNNRPAVGVEIEEGVATVSSEDVYEFVINGPDKDGLYTIYDVREHGYLFAAGSGSGKNYLRTQSPNDANGQWTITIAQDGSATIVAQGTNTNKYMRFNNTLFSCYAETSSVTALPYLFVKDDDTNYEFYKDIKAYQGEGGYVLVASPVSTNPGAAGMITDELGAQATPETATYDLYSFDQAQELEWINYRKGEFSLEPGKGYLYANKNDVTLTFAGEPSTTSSATLSLSGTGEFAGWNLVGNPFSVPAYIGTRAYYRIGNGGANIVAATPGTAIDVMEGVFVIAAQAGEQLAFSTTAAKGASVAMNVVRERGNVIDRAIVRFDEGDQLPKFQLNPNNTKIYVTEGNKDYAVVRSAAEAEMPVSFRASENGTYTLAIEAENVEMNYLHLIDNLTGMDVDLLQTPSYTFEAKTSDYASRFRLVFKANSTNENNAEAFAYFNGTNWTVSNVGDATLQVVDVTGRTVANQMINGNAELNLNQPAGVYVIRLVNGDNVKTQKVVVR